MAGTIQKKEELVKELKSQEVLLRAAWSTNVELENKLSNRRVIGWTLLIILIAVIAFTTGGVVAEW